MIVDIDKVEKKNGVEYKNQSAKNYIEYLTKEDKLSNEFFNFEREDISSEEAIELIDKNWLGKGLSNKQAKFYTFTINPSEKELKHIQNSKEALKAFAKKSIELYAHNFKRDIPPEQVVWVARIEKSRTYKHNSIEVQANREYLKKKSDYTYIIRNEKVLYLERKQLQDQDIFIGHGTKKVGLNSHVHFVVSRNLRDSRVKLTPTTDEREHSKTTIKGVKVHKGFSRRNHEQGCEMLFDKMFSYHRTLVQTHHKDKVHQEALSLSQKENIGINQALLKTANSKEEHIFELGNELKNTMITKKIMQKERKKAENKVKKLNYKDLYALNEKQQKAIEFYKDKIKVLEREYSIAPIPNTQKERIRITLGLLTKQQQKATPNQKAIGKHYLTLALAQKDKSPLHKKYYLAVRDSDKQKAVEIRNKIKDYESQRKHYYNMLKNAKKEYYKTNRKMGIMEKALFQHDKVSKDLRKINKTIHAIASTDNQLKTYAKFLEVSISSKKNVKIPTSKKSLKMIIANKSTHNLTMISAVNNLNVDFIKNLIQPKNLILSQGKKLLRSLSNFD